MLACLLVVGLLGIGAVAALWERLADGHPEGDVASDPVPEVDARLTWAPPELSDPQTVDVTPERRSLELDRGSDYVVRLPDRPLTGSGGLVIDGGRNVVLIGGEIRIDEGDGLSGRGLLLRGQTGTVHIEGLLLTGHGLTEGINLDQRKGAVVQLQNIHVGLVRGIKDGHHADIIQSWAGPAELRVDRLSGTTGYQGFFLQPLEYGDQRPTIFDLRRVDLVGTERAGYLLWRDDESWPLITSQVWLEHQDRGKAIWDDGGLSGHLGRGITLGRPPGGSFVPADAVGLGYVSPGYRPR